MNLTVAECRGYVNSFKQSHAGMIFAGATGKGKTHYACAVANEIIHHWGKTSDVSVKFFNMNLHLPLLLDNRYFKRYDDYARTIRTLENCDLLIVDDLLHVANVEWAKEVLYRIYEARYSKELRTITTLNLNPFADGNDADWSAISNMFNDAFMRRVVTSGNDKIITP